MLKVIGVGDNVVDKYIYRGIMYPGGNALNFSVYSKMLGFDSAYLGIFGTDFAGKYVYKVLDDMGLELSHCRSVEGENGYACVNLIDGDRKFVHSNHGGVSNLSPLKFTESDLDYLSGFDLIHSSINSYGFQIFLKAIHERNMTVSFDFSSRFNDENLKELGQYVNYAICSCGHLSIKETQQLMKKALAYGFDGVLATKGIDGSYFADNQGVYYSKSDTQLAKDTLGAGDSFCTCFLTSYLASLKEKKADKVEQSIKIKEALEKATHFATKTCMVDGAFDHGIQIQ